MNQPGPPLPLALERLQHLKQRAQAALAQAQAPQAAAPPEALRLLEELRTYQAELELQNEELRAAQQDAELARRRYHSLFSQLPMPTLVLDAQGVIEECNPLADALLGERARFVTLDRRLWRHLGSKDTARLHAALRASPAGERVVLHEVVVSAQESASTPVYDLHLIGLDVDYKLDRRVLCLLVDRSAEMARQQELRLLARLLDASDSLICATDRQGKVLLANRALLAHWGRDLQAAQGQRREAFMPLRQALAHNQADQQVLQSGQPLTLSGPATHADGDAEWVTRKFPLRDGRGHLLGVGSLSTDVSSLRDGQRAAQLGDAVFQCCDEAILVLDPVGRILRVNPAFTRQSGYTAASVVGRQTRVLVSERQNDAFVQAMTQTLRRTGRWSGELENRRADGSTYWVACSINAVYDTRQQLQCYIAIQTDLTQHRHLPPAEPPPPPG